jgi:hypothetical protein
MFINSNSFLAEIKLFQLWFTNLVKLTPKFDHGFLMTNKESKKVS